MNQNDYPINAFPPVFKGLFSWGNTEKSIPTNLIGHVTMTALSIACQPLINVIVPYSSEPEPCSLFCITIAESGEGKTTVSKLLMKPFYDVSSLMVLEYKAQLIDYKRNYDTWQTMYKGLKSKLKQASKKGYDTTTIEE